MKRVVFVVLFLIFIVPEAVLARRGCCSHHGGVAGCSPSGRQICADGSLSPTCTCVNSTYRPPTYIYGCTDAKAFNYNPSATKDDGSCVAKRFGCMDNRAINYDPAANVSDDSCRYEKTITFTEQVEFDKKYKENNSMLEGKEKIVVRGVNGKKEVIYLAIVDKNEKIITKEKISEKIVIVPVDQVIEKGSKKESFPVFGFLLWFVSLVFSFCYFHNHRDNYLILTKFSNQKELGQLLFYFIYIFCVLPPIIDAALIIFHIIFCNKK